MSIIPADWHNDDDLRAAARAATAKKTCAVCGHSYFNAGAHAEECEGAPRCAKTVLVGVGSRRRCHGTRGHQGRCW